tara:strand:- start:294 stop:1193 length:900 start_codon:yes stop_codon:yes gene_type:complete
MFNINSSSKITAKIAIRGIATNKAALPKEAVKGDVYVTSEEGEVFVHNGTVWKSAGAFAITGLPGKDGEKGAAGIAGKQGPQGEPGKTGPAGKDGSQGPRGLRGNAGLPGTPGAPGAAGKDGVDGHDGLPGHDGHNGAVGPQGPQGDKGDVGPQGPQGEQGIQGEKGDSDIEYPAPGVVVSNGDGWETSLPLASLIKSAEEQTLINKTLKSVTYGCSVVYGSIDALKGFLQTLVLSKNETISLANFKEGSMVRITVVNKNGFSIIWPKIHWVSGCAPKLTTLSVVEIWKSNGQLMGIKL